MTLVMLNILSRSFCLAAFAAAAPNFEQLKVVVALLLLKTRMAAPRVPSSLLFSVQFAVKPFLLRQLQPLESTDFRRHTEHY